MADTGWLVPATAAVVTDGNDSWSNTGNAFASDNSYATSSISKNNRSHTLRVSNFNAAVPADATNIRLEVSIERKASGSSTVDYLVQWFNGTARAGNNKASSSNWPTSDAVATYGSSTDTWSASITPAQANSGTAGIDLAVTNNASASRTASVDQIRVKYYYNAVYEISAAVQANCTVTANTATIIGSAAEIAAVSAFSTAAIAVTNTSLPVSCAVSVTITAEQVSADPANTYAAISCSTELLVEAVQISTATAAILSEYQISAVPEVVRQIGAAISVVSGCTVNATQVLNNRIKYTLTHPTYGSRLYEVVVKVLKSALNNIERFYFTPADNPALTAVIEATIREDTISVTLPDGVNLRALKPTIEPSIEAGISPASGTVTDFTNPVVYTVTSETAETKAYTATATIAAATGKSIVRFNILKILNPALSADLLADVFESNAVIIAPNYADTVLMALKPTIQISKGATIVPANTQVKDFSGTVTYRLTAGDQTKATCTADLYRRLDIGSPPAAGQVTVTGGAFTMLGSGSDIWGTSDQFHFLYRKMTGDCTAEVLLETQQATNDWAKAGLMVRSSLTANAPHVMLGMAPLLDGTNHTLFYSYRLTAGGTSTMQFQGSIDAPPVWLRIEKTGTVLNAYRKTPTGTTWTLIESVTVPLIGSTAYVGFAVCSKTTGLGQCVFRGLRVG